MEIKAVGVTFNDRQANLKKAFEDKDAFVWIQPVSNEYDHNAIAVMSNHGQLGFLPRDTNANKMIVLAFKISLYDKDKYSCTLYMDEQKNVSHILSEKQVKFLQYQSNRLANKMNISVSEAKKYIISKLGDPRNVLWSKYREEVLKL